MDSGVEPPLPPTPLAAGVVLAKDVWPASMDHILSPGEESSGNESETDSEPERFNSGGEDGVEGGEIAAERAPLLQPLGVSFATDLLVDYEAVRQRSTANVKALEELESLLKARAAVEETYAKGLERVANNFKHEVLHSGSAQAALSALRADLLNKADQHRNLAGQLMAEVQAPLAELRALMATRMKAVNARVLKAHKECRSLEDKYRRAHSKYHRAYRDAVHTHTSLVADGKVTPKPQLKSQTVTANRSPSPPSPSLAQACQQQQHQQHRSTSSIGSNSQSGSPSKISTSAQQQSGSSSSAQHQSNNSAPQPSSSSSSAQQPSKSHALALKYKKNLLGGLTSGGGGAVSDTLTRVLDAMPSMPSVAKHVRRSSSNASNTGAAAAAATVMATNGPNMPAPATPSPATISKSDVMIQWLLPTEQQRMESLAESARSAHEAAEDARRACRQAYDALCLQVQVTCHELQASLNENQAAESTFASELQDGLRRNAVFESSSLANEQYDVQMVFKVMETIDGRTDMQKFVQSRQSVVQQQTVVTGSVPGADVGPEEAMDQTSIAVLQQVFNIIIAPDLLAHPLGDDDSLNSAATPMYGDLPAPPPDAPIKEIPVAGDAMEGSSVPEIPDDLLALLRLPLVSKHDVLGVMREEAAAAAARPDRNDSRHGSPGTPHSRSGGSTGGSPLLNASGTQSEAGTVEAGGLLPAEAVGKLLSIVERGHGKGRLQIPPQVLPDND